MDVSDDKLRSISSLLSRRLCTLYQKSSAHTSICRNLGVLREVLQSHKFNMISGGSWVEGTVTTTSDFDTMFIEPSILVVHDSREMREVRGNALIANTSHSSPGYTRLQYLEENEMECPWPFDHYLHGSFETTDDGILLTSVKLVESVLDETLRRHGPCISTALDISGSVYHETEEKPDMDIAFGLVCNSWPEEAMDWFTRNRKHDWPSEDLINKIQKKDCHVVPVGNPMSEHPSLEWRFSFILAERQLIWSFNDTQIQCYVILKSLIKKYIHPTVPDEVTSYHLKTIVFWQSENLGITAWREDQLLHRVLDCLSYLSQCVMEGRLEHFFYRSNNLLRHKLSKSVDRKFVLDKIKFIKINLAEDVLDIFPGRDALTMRSEFGPDNVEHFLRFLNNATQHDYGHLKYVIEKYSEYTRGCSVMFRSVTNTLNDENSFRLALTALKENPPPDVDPIYIERTLQFIDIRLAIHCYNASQNHSYSPQVKRNLKNDSLVLMKRGAEIEDHVGKLYLATLYFCLEKYSDCENLILQVVKRRQELLNTWDNEASSFIKACKLSLNVIHKHIPGIVDLMLTAHLPLVFSKEDVEFVPYPLKFECAMATQEAIQLDPSAYGLTLFIMTQLSMKETGLARKYLDNFAKLTDKTRHSPSHHHRLYNLLGCCYSLDGQLEKAGLCFMKSLTSTRGSPIGKANAALYHLAILCLTFIPEEN